MARIYGNRWQVVESLDQGGQASIFKVLDLQGSADDFFALKRLTDINRNDRFSREIEALKSLSHPNITPLIDHSDLTIVDPKHKSYLVMPLAKGGTAEKRRAEFSSDITKVVSLGRQVVLALGAAHERGIVHRDVKPANILFPQSGTDIWLSDFGICRFDNSVEQTPDGRIMGPRRFSAPEIEQAENEIVNKSVDFYSLGQVLIYLYSGKTFHREGVFSTDFDDILNIDQRTKSFRLMLSRMVVQQGARFSSTEQILGLMDEILNWSIVSQGRVLSSKLHERIVSLRIELREGDTKRELEAQEKERVQALHKAVLEAASAAIESHCSSLAEALADGGDLECKVALDPKLVSFNFNSKSQRCETAVSLIVRRKEFRRVQGTLFTMLCRNPNTTGKWMFYCGFVVNGSVYLTSESMAVTAAASNGGVSFANKPLRPLLFTPEPSNAEPNPQSVNFSVDQWPQASADVINLIEKSFDQFLTHFVTLTP